MVQLEQVKTRVKTSNKIVLDSEKEKDTAEQEVQRLHNLLQAERSRTHTTTTNVALDSREETTPKKGKTVPLDHFRLGLVGWIVYCSLGNCTLTVKIIVGLNSSEFCVAGFKFNEVL